MNNSLMAACLEAWYRPITLMALVTAGKRTLTVLVILKM